jgi:hypothetical protein
MGVPHETIIAGLGSRLSINFRPRERELWLSPLGRFFDKPVALNFGVVCGGQRYSLCFGKRDSDFQFIEQHEKLDGVLFRCRDYRVGLECEFEFTAPFYPQDGELSPLPSIYVTARIKALPGSANGKATASELSVFCDATRSEFAANLDGRFYMSDVFKLADDHIHYQNPEYLRELTNDYPFGINGVFGEMVIDSPNPHRIENKMMLIDASADQYGSFECCFVLSGFVKDAVMSANGKMLPLKYTERFSGIGEVSEFSLKNYRRHIKKSAAFADAVTDSSLGRDFNVFLGISMRSFLANTWWCSDSDGGQFTVWEGNCVFHSTLDVEYSCGFFYLLCWPELLERSFKNWADTEQNGFLAHDLGVFLTIGKQAYSHNMEIEENCNFILLLYAYYKYTGKAEILTRYAPLIKKLTAFNKSCDKTGNGLANVGTSNTIDDASAEIQFSEEQVYLGVKEYATYLAAAELLEKTPLKDHAKLCVGEASKINAYIEANAWRADHYAVSLSDNVAVDMSGIYNSEVQKNRDEANDAYSIYTANGLLYLMMCGRRLTWDADRLRADITASERACMTEFGCTHSSVDKANAWISQNVWRDLCAGYLGSDMQNNVQRYLDFIMFENIVGRGGCFIDTYGWNKLCYYPRGLSGMGYLLSAAGFSLDRPLKEVGFEPSRVPVKVPLLALADYQKGLIPVFEARFGDGKTEYVLSDPIDGYSIKIFGRFYTRRADGVLVEKAQQ